MICEIRQTVKKLYGAEFDVIRNGESVGHVKLCDGILQARPSPIEIDLFGKRITLRYDGKRFGGIRRYTIDGEDRRVMIPYAIESGEQSIGMIYGNNYGQYQNLTGSTRLEYFSAEYVIYPLVFDGHLFREPIYRGDIQVAQIEEDFGMIHDDLHRYQIYAVDQDSLLVAVLFAAYMYTVIGSYVRGEKRANYAEKKAIKANVSPEKAAMYHEDFISGISE